MTSFMDDPKANPKANKIFWNNVCVCANPYMSISSTIYVYIFCTKLLFKLSSSYVLALEFFCVKILYEKRARKMLMKLTVGIRWNVEEFLEPSAVIYLGGVRQVTNWPTIKFNILEQTRQKCGPPTYFCGPWTLFCYVKNLNSAVRDAFFSNLACDQKKYGHPCFRARMDIDCMHFRSQAVWKFYAFYSKYQGCRMHFKAK